MSEENQLTFYPGIQWFLLLMVEMLPVLEDMLEQTIYVRWRNNND